MKLGVYKSVYKKYTAVLKSGERFEHAAKDETHLLRFFNDCLSSSVP